MQNRSLSPACMALAWAYMVFTRLKCVVITGFVFPALPEVNRMVSASSHVTCGHFFGRGRSSPSRVWIGSRPGVRK